MKEEWELDRLWLEGQIDAGHCGESTSEAIWRGRHNERVKRLLARVDAAYVARQFIDRLDVYTHERTVDDRVYVEAPVLVKNLADVLGYADAPHEPEDED